MCWKGKDHPLDIAGYCHSGYIFCAVWGDSCEMLLAVRDYSAQLMMAALLIEADALYYINVPFK